MSETKLKIIKGAQELFFENGIANIRLQQIADSSGISVGNLAYHFKNKDAIVYALYDNLFNELSEILAQYLSFQQLIGFDKQFTAMYNFYSQNEFTFNNHWEIKRNYPEIQKEWYSTMNKMSLQIKKRFEFNIEHGFFKPEPWKGAYDSLVQSLCFNINYWIPQQMLMGKAVKEETYKKHLWSVLYPVFTTKGIKEFEQTIMPILF